MIMLAFTADPSGLLCDTKSSQGSRHFRHSRMLGDRVQHVIIIIIVMIIIIIIIIIIVINKLEYRYLF